VYHPDPHSLPFHKRYGFGIALALLFLGSWIAQFVTGLYAERAETTMHGQVFLWDDYLWKFFNATMENWQSEFLQLLFQVGGLAFLYFVGSPQSRDADERMERKLDVLLRKSGTDPKDV
jgi:hypothetical protein